MNSLKSIMRLHFAMRWIHLGLMALNTSFVVHEVSTGHHLAFVPFQVFLVAFSAFFIGWNIEKAWAIQDRLGDHRSELWAWFKHEYAEDYDDDPDLRCNCAECTRRRHPEPISSIFGSEAEWTPAFMSGLTQLNPVREQHPRIADGKYLLRVGANFMQQEAYEEAHKALWAAGYDLVHVTPKHGDVRVVGIQEGLPRYEVVIKANGGACHRSGSGVWRGGLADAHVRELRSRRGWA